MVSAEPGISLSELFRRAAEGMSRDDIYALIASRELFVDLGTAPLAEPERVHVFANREAEVAYCHVAQSAEATTDNCRGFSVHAGRTIGWDGRTWTIVNPGEKTISLLGEDEALTELPVSVFEKLTKEGRIHGLSAKQECAGRPETAVLACSRRDRSQCRQSALQRCPLPTARRAGASHLPSVCADCALMGVTLSKGGGLFWQRVFRTLATQS